MILANIDKTVLVNLLSVIDEIKGCLILSGLLESDFKQIKKIIDNKGYVILDKFQKNEWISLVIK